MDRAYNIFLLLGGIGLFLFGINYMGAGLENAAGNNLRIWLEKLTQKPLHGVAVGAAATGVIQSSGATMVMTAGFVNARLMTLSQALYVMLGASIGTTVTAQIIAFKINPWAPLIVFAGLILTQFVKKRVVRKTGAIVLGFGILFVGINLMGDAVKAMDLGTVIGKFLENAHNPLLAMLFGFVFTFVIQSSSASVGILQVLVSGGAGAVFGLEAVACMIMGMNVGAVAPLVISSFSGNRLSRRVALAEVLAKVMSVAVVSLIITLFPSALTLIESLSPGSVSRQIANFHLIFNLASAAALFPFVPLLSRFVTGLMPDDPENEFYARRLLYCTADPKKGPAVMLAQARKEVLRFAEICKSNMVLALESFFSMDEEKAELVLERERVINYLNHELNAYLVKLYSKELSESDAVRTGTMFGIVSDLERIGDLAENVAEYTQIAIGNKARFSAAAVKDLKEMSEKVTRMMDVSLLAYEKGDMELLAQAREIEAEVDAMQAEKTERHIERLKKEICEPRGGVIYTDMVSDMERCADHAMNVAEGILGIDASMAEMEEDL